jgi:hypothetical protein
MSVLVEPELGEDAADMSLDRLEFDPELLADGSVGPTLGHEREDLQLSSRELVEQVVSDCGHRFFVAPG